MRHRLFAVHVQTRVEAVDGLLGMPMIGRADRNRIDVSPLEEFLVVLGRERFVALLLLDLVRGKVEVRLIHVADGRDLHIGLLQERIVNLVAPIAEADEADAEFAIRLGNPCIFFRSLRCPRSQGQTGERGARGKLATIQ